jgi:polyhydroxyalkanoate synthesis repressor PhaR
MNANEKKRVIKRYANRKLYDTEESCYVTHEEIARLVRSGEDIQIIDNESKDDLTGLTLAQILTKEERRKRRTLPLHTLRNILQTGGERLQERITQQVSAIREEAVETVRSVLRPGDAAGGLGGDPPGPGPEAVREWLDKSQRGYENLSRTLEERWDLMVNALNHLDDSRKRIAELEKRVQDLETELQSRKGD